MDDLALLEQILRRQLEAQHELLGCVGNARAALRGADMESLHSACEQEHAVTHRLTELEKERLELVGRLTEKLAPEAVRPLTMSRITEAFEEPARGRLSRLGGELKAAVREVRDASSVVRTAADELARHMAGIFQAAQSALSRARVYSARGRITAGAQDQYCLDVTS